MYIGYCELLIVSTFVYLCGLVKVIDLVGYSMCWKLPVVIIEFVILGIQVFIVFFLILWLLLAMKSLSCNCFHCVLSSADTF